ncbi:MAG TPA: hypothetical protein VFU98_15750 [Microlunatus sp.]|nr:hypothetical protein [Microlunatus sp.]
MRYLVLLSPTNQPDTPPPPDLFEAILQLGAEASAAGVLLDQSGLQPSSEGALVSLRQGDIQVTDGPFTESKEIVSYAVYETRDRAETVEWAERFLRLHRDRWPGYEGEAKVLPLFAPPSGPGV